MNLDDLHFISKLTNNLFNIPVFFLDRENQLVFKYAGNSRHNPIYGSFEDVFVQLKTSTKPIQLPIFKTTDNLEEFFSIHVDGAGTMVVGPFLSFRPTEEMLLTMIRNLTNKKDLQASLLQYFQDLPVINNKKILSICQQLYYMIFKQILKTEDIIFGNKVISPNSPVMEESSMEISQRRLNLAFHSDFMVEKHILQFIKEGKKEEFIKAFRLGPKNEELGVLSKKDQLRSNKNLAISFITIATRSAIDGGLHYELAYTLSDLYIQNIEEINDIKAIEVYIEDAIADMAERVKLSKQLRYSKPINSCLNYIFKHLYDEIKLTDLGDLVDMHPNYLSSLFKREVGTTLTEYIQRSKIEEAKSLLTFTDYSLSQISTMLNFHDQSHFTTVFKKITGITPKRYKNN